MRTIATERRLLTVGETAERLRLSVPTTYRKIARAEIPCVRLGNASGPLRVVEDELMAWLFAEPGDAKVAGVGYVSDPAGAPRTAREAGVEPRMPAGPVSGEGR